MLFRLVRPMKRTGSRNRYYVRRIPTDVREQAAGLKLAIPVGDQLTHLVVSPRAQSVRVSLRTDDPREVKVRQGAVNAYLENVWRALRENAPVSLDHRQATALAGELYCAWAGGEGRERTIAMERVPGHGWQRSDETHVQLDEWAGVKQRWERIDAGGDVQELERSLGPIIDRLLLAK